MRSLLSLLVLLLASWAVFAPVASADAAALATPHVPAPEVDLPPSLLSEEDILGESPYIDHDASLLGAEEGEIAEEDLVLSPRTQAVLEFDAQYARAIASNESTAHVLKVSGLGMTTAYNHATATKLFWHSVTAYCNANSALSGWSCKSCKQFGDFHVTGVMTDSANQGYVGYFTQGLPSTPIPGSPIGANEPFVLVSFRGTVPTKLSNWIEDLSFSKSAALGSKYPGVGVHSGFWAAYQRLKAKLLPGLSAAFAKSGARAVIFTGHSLGAAMAELAALDLKLNEYPNKFFATYTQGAPRPGNAKYSELFSKVISAAFREVHQADCVPHLPPMALGFQHGPTEVWLNKDFSPKVCSGSSGEDKKCSDSLLMPISVPDHLTYRKGVSVGGYCNAK